MLNAFFDELEELGIEAYTGLLLVVQDMGLLNDVNDAANPIPDVVNGRSEALSGRPYNIEGGLIIDIF